MIFGSSVDPVREFIRAFNEQDLDAFVEVLDPAVELHSGRGLRKGIEAARLWATKSPGGAQQTITLDDLYEESDRAVALITRAWHWEEDGSHAGDEEMAWVFELRDRRILSWRPYEDREEALRVAHFGVR
ncbi:MAG TPA: nuclear transport factor 2 family protein [Solirubrobacterales bacterium]|nr:nuclear transport factor 2 family protein [Solirubrobacterales bacterium]